MADWDDDWENEAERLVAGVDIHEVDESKFEGEEDEAVVDDWDADVPAPQVKVPLLIHTCKFIANL
jgi:hypothetical protein